MLEIIILTLVFAVRSYLKIALNAFYINELDVSDAKQHTFVKRRTNNRYMFWIIIYNIIILKEIIK